MDPPVIKIPFMPIENFKIENLDHFQGDDSGEGVISFDKFPSNTDFDRCKFSKDVALILCGMGMEKYIDLFKAEDINLEFLFGLTISDLHNLGVTDRNDQKTIINNLKEVKECFGEIGVSDISQSYIVPESSIEDVIMAANVLKHLVLLENYASYTVLRMGKEDLWDYFVSKDKTAVQIFKLVTDKAIQQAESCVNLLNGANDNLIDTALRVENLSLPPHLSKKLKNTRKSSNISSRRRRKDLVLKVFAVTGLACCLVLIGRQVFSQICSR